MLSLNRGFSAPVRLTSGLATTDLLFLIAHDSDSFNRWEAAQTIGRQLIIDGIKRRHPAGRRSSPTAFAEALAAGAATSRRLDAQFLSLMLTCRASRTSPARSPAMSIRELVHDARETVRRQLGRALEPELEALLATEAARGAAIGPIRGSVGKRSLRHAALALLAAANPRSRRRPGLRRTSRAPAT